MFVKVSNINFNIDFFILIEYTYNPEYKYHNPYQIPLNKINYCIGLDPQHPTNIFPFIKFNKTNNYYLLSYLNDGLNNILFSVEDKIYLGKDIKKLYTFNKDIKKIFAGMSNIFRYYDTLEEAKLDKIKNFKIISEKMQEYSNYLTLEKLI